VLVAGYFLRSVCCLWRWAFTFTCKYPEASEQGNMEPILSEFLIFALPISVKGPLSLMRHCAPFLCIAKAATRINPDVARFGVEGSCVSVPEATVAPVAVGVGPKRIMAGRVRAASRD